MIEQAAKTSTLTRNKDLVKFTPGDLAVYPAHGVGRIESIETREVDGDKQDFYIMDVFEKNMVIMIPIKNANSVCLRNVVGKDEIPKIYKILQKKPRAFVNNVTWSRRHRDYMDKIKTGSLYDVAEVYMEIFNLKFVKELSFGERKLFDMVQSLLINEICIVKNEERDAVKSEIESLFTREKEQ